jgi:hypothetical protein
MGDAFHGWRRKMGLATLVIALGLAASWVRGHDTQEQLRLQCRNRDCFIWHGAGLVGLSVMNSNQNKFRFRWDTRRLHSKELLSVPELPLFNFSSQGVVIKIWCVELPMTLLSAFLLLGTPTSSTPRTIVEPAPERSV